MERLCVCFLFLFFFFLGKAQDYNYYKTLKGHKEEVSHICLRLEDNLLASGDVLGNIILWNIKTGSAIKKIKEQSQKITHLEFDNEGKFLASASYDGTIKIWDTKNFELVSKINIPSGASYADVKGNEPTFLAFNQSGQIIFFGGYNSNVHSYNLETKELLEIYEDQEFGITSGVLTSDSKFLLFAAGARVYIFDIEKNKIVKKIGNKNANNSKNYICELAVSNLGILGIWTYGGRVNFYNLNEGYKFLHFIQATTNLGSSNISFSEDSKFFLTGNHNNITNLWNFEKKEVKQVLEKHKNHTTTFTFSRDDTYIITGSNDNNVIVWKKELPKISNDKIFNKIEDRIVEVQKVINTKEDTANIYFWDSKTTDGDIISVYFNGKRILNNHKLDKKKEQVNVSFNEGQNLIVIHAHNLGKIPPNTIGVIIDIGEKSKSYTFQSDKNKSAAILIKK